MSDIAPRRESSLPPGLRLYAVGDLHGRADLLVKLLSEIEADAVCRPSPAKRVVFLGDYVDRGPQSKEVIDLVLDAAPGGAEIVALIGNHEEMMLRFLWDTSIGHSWMLNGGDATLASYGVEPPNFLGGEADYQRAQEEFDAALPEPHRDFLAGLAVTHTAGDYLFVHAGVRPRVPLDRQRREDQLWIRDQFLRSDMDFGKVVVHGHSIAEDPVVRHNRIGIDTGAYATGKLTCLVLEGASRSFLST